MHYIKSYIGNIPIVSDELLFMDILGAIKARWSINRNSFKVVPGLYAVGIPENNSNIFISANYKLSFDHLRKNLKGINAWILVIDTKGVNVWCAAGKGTFGTAELISKINAYLIGSEITTKKLIVPQLGAVGVSAHEVKAKTDYKIIYGPVEAKDIKAFILNDYTATKEQREIGFNFYNRLILTPVELVAHFKYLLFFISAIFIISGLKSATYELDNAFLELKNILINTLTAYLGGTVIVPILLPYIPFRNFSFKGLIIGLIFSSIIYSTGNMGESYLENISWFLLNMAICSFTAMNFTGASTYTSFSGVMKEMKIAIPLQITFFGIGLIIFIISRFI